jgi:hypothetical protein
MRTAPGPILTAVLLLTLILLVLMLSPKAFADTLHHHDPEPVEYQHREVYFASIFAKQPDAGTSTAPTSK